MPADPRAVTGSVCLGLGALLATSLWPGPAPVPARFVYLEGGVEEPGWYAADSLGRAVAAAGGAIRFVDAEVQDGDRVHVVAGYGLVQRDPAPVETSAWTPGKLRLNQASLAELEALPRVGPVLAARIVAGRPYARFEDLDRVKGVGPHLLATLRPLAAP